MSTLEELVVELLAKTDRMEANLIRLERQYDGLGRQVRKQQSTIESATASMTSRIEKLGTAAGATTRLLGRLGVGFSAAAALAFTKRAIDAADAMNDLSERTGVAASTLQGFEYVAKLTGTRVEAFATGIGRMNRVIGEAATGNDSARQKIEQLGLSLAQLEGLSAEQQFLTLADRIAGLGSQAERTKATMDLFGRSGLELAGAMKGGAAGMRAMLDEARNLGLVMSEEELQRIARFNDEWDTMTLKLQALARDGFLWVADAARDAYEQIALMKGQLDDVSLSSLTDEAGELRTRILEFQKSLAEMGADDPARASMEQALAGTREELDAVEAAMGRLVDRQMLQQRTQRAATAANDAGATSLATMAEKGETLQDALDELQRKAYGEKLASTMTEAEQAVLGVDQAVADLVRRFGPLDERMRKQVETIKEMAGDAAWLKELREASQSTAAEWDRKIQDMANKAPELAEPVRNMLEGIQEEFADFGTDLFDGILDNAEDTLPRIKRLFARELGEMAAMAASSLVFGGEGGILSGGAGTARAAAGGKSGASGLASNGVGLLGKVGGITTAIDAWGAAALPSLFGTGAPVAGVVGPQAAGLLGGAGIGLSAVALPLAGLALSGVLGSVFSGPRAHPASTFGVRGGNFGALDLRAKHMDTSYASGLAGSLQQSLAALGAAGLDTSFLRSMDGGVDDGTGFLTFGDWRRRNPMETVTFKPDQADNGLARFLKLVLDASGDLSKVMDAELVPAMKKLSTEGKGAEQVLNEIVAALTRDDLRAGFVKQLDAALLEELSPGYGELMGLFTDYQEALKQAAEYGASAADTAKITTLYELRRAAATRQTSEAAREQAERAGDLVRRYGQLAERFGDIAFDLQYGQYSLRTPTSNLAALRQMVQDTGARARLGDADAQERLAGLIPQFVELSGSVNGFNAAFERDRAMAEELARDTQSVAQRQLSVQEGILASSQSTNAFLQSLLSAGTGGNANDKLIAAIAGGWREATPGMIESIFASAGVTVAPGNGRRSQFLGSAEGAASNDRLNAIFRSLGIPGFAGGGLITGPAGLDRVPTLHTAGEFTLKKAAVDAIGLPTLDFMNATGRAPAANDNGTAAALRALAQSNNRLAAAIAANGKVTVEHLAAIDGNIDRMAAVRGAAWG